MTEPDFPSGAGFLVFFQSTSFAPVRARQVRHDLGPARLRETFKAGPVNLRAPRLLELRTHHSDLAGGKDMQPG